MARFSYPNFPFPFYRNYSRVPKSSYNYPPSHMSNSNYYAKNNTAHNSPPEFNTSFSTHITPDENEDCRNFKQKNKSNKNNDDYLFDLFGLKIYSDDVLLVSLIYFLYSEGVKDDSLFLVLILLLLS